MDDKKLTDSNEKFPENRKAGTVIVLKPGFAWNPFTKFPRNLPCYCGSGTKFKRCHSGKISEVIASNKEMESKRLFNSVVKQIQDLSDRGVIFKLDKSLETLKGEQDEINKV